MFQLANALSGVPVEPFKNCVFFAIDQSRQKFCADRGKQFQAIFFSVVSYLCTHCESSAVACAVDAAAGVLWDHQRCACALMYGRNPVERNEQCGLRWKIWCQLPVVEHFADSVHSSSGCGMNGSHSACIREDSLHFNRCLHAISCTLARLLVHPLVKVSSPWCTAQQPSEVLANHTLTSSEVPACKIWCCCFTRRTTEPSSRTYFFRSALLPDATEVLCSSSSDRRLRSADQLLCAPCLLSGFGFVVSDPSVHEYRQRLARRFSIGQISFVFMMGSAIRCLLIQYQS